MTRCPRCGTPADAVAVTFHVPPAARRPLRERLEVVRRELGLRSDGEALAAAVRIVGLDLNLRADVGSGDAGRTARAIRSGRTQMGEHEQEQREGQPDEAAAQDEGAAQPDGAENANAGEEAAPLAPPPGPEEVAADGENANADEPGQGDEPAPAQPQE